MRAPLPAVCLLLAACSQPAPLLSLPGTGPTAPLVTTAPRVLPPPSEEPPLAPSPPSDAVATAAIVAPPPPAVLLEPPYSARGHAPLATEMLTLARDEELFQWALGGSSDPAHPANQRGYHPATRVVVDVELLSRAPKGSTKRLLRIARSAGYWPLRACFEDAQRAALKPERAAKVRLTLSAFGKVLGARILGKSSEPEYARCVLRQLRALDFTPGFTRKLDVEISVKQWPGHAPVPPRSAELPLRLAPGVRAAFEALSPALTSCYEQGLSTDGKLWGRIALRLQLADDGTVQAATPVETQFPSAVVTECARQAVLSARLPPSGVSELTFAVRLGQGALPTPPSPESASPSGTLASPAESEPVRPEPR